MQDPPPRPHRAFAVSCLLAAGLYACIGSAPTRSFQPEIPRTWDEAAMATLELPNAHTGKPAEHISAAQYYALPEWTIYKTYPVYAKDRMPPGYLDELREKEPEISFDASRLSSEADWLHAGELAFRWPTELNEYKSGSKFFLQESMAHHGGRTTPEGIDPYTVFVIREKGKIEIGHFSCAGCHTRVLGDGRVILGAQGNSPMEQAYSSGMKVFPPDPFQGLFKEFCILPVSDPDKPHMPQQISMEELYRHHSAMPPGVMVRQGTSPWTPVQIPDLIGVQRRRYLDRTGLMRHRDIGDMMRYAALNQGMDSYSRWDGFQPVAYKVPAPGEAPDPIQLRYSEAALYALSLFVYSLAPPPNPNRMDELARRGEQVFARENCARCHSGPDMGGEQLVPVQGFEIPADLRQTEKIRRLPIGNDPRLALINRRSTGFYKVPSLRGLWYRGPFGHSGQVATLEEWFDPARLRDDYVASGFNPGRRAAAVAGHEFGTDLPAAERAALVAYLRTL